MVTSMDVTKDHCSCEGVNPQAFPPTQENTETSPWKSAYSHGAHILWGTLGDDGDTVVSKSREERRHETTIVSDGFM